MPAPAWIAPTALVVAALSMIGTLGNFLRTRHRDRREEQRKYADTVSAWTGLSEECMVVSSPDAYHYHEVVVANASDQPVYDVVVNIQTVENGKEGTAVYAVGLVPPGGRVRQRIGDIGQAEQQFAIPLPVWFTDAHGVRWCRDGQGRLRRAKRERTVVIEESEAAEA